MRSIFAALACALLALPSAHAAHVGPCTHEYLDIGLRIASDALDGRLMLAPIAAAGNCVQGTIDWVCQPLGGCEVVIECDTMDCLPP